jgi:DnaJ-class molecular chaperone
MTQPVFSEREVAMIRSIRIVCPTCQGRRRIITSRPTKMYACGYATCCESCPECHGMGSLDPNPIPDFKTEASNDQQ